MEVNNKKQITLTIVAVVTLIALVAGATYAYFAVGVTNNFGTSTINATAGNVGMVTLNGTNASLTMALSATDMMKSNANTYYASSEGKTTTPTFVTIGTASVSPNTDTNYYHCTYQLSVTHNGTKDMYDWFNHKTNDTYDYTNRSEEQIILTINGEDYDFTGEWPSTINGEFYTKVGSPVKLTAGLMFANKSYIDQTYMAGTDISLSLTVPANSLKCSAANPAEIPIANINGYTLTKGDIKSVAIEKNLNDYYPYAFIFKDENNSEVLRFNISIETDYETGAKIVQPGEVTCSQEIENQMNELDHKLYRDFFEMLGQNELQEFDNYSNKYILDLFETDPEGLEEFLDTLTAS